ncbi:hypothetical protein J3F84DRAFT_228323 [Trichoderma pleuroticola]
MTESTLVGCFCSMIGAAEAVSINGLPAVNGERGNGSGLRTVETSWRLSVGRNARLPAGNGSVLASCCFIILIPMAFLPKLGFLLNQHTSHTLAA